MRCPGDRMVVCDPCELENTNENPVARYADAGHASGYESSGPLILDAMEGEMGTKPVELWGNEALHYIAGNLRQTRIDNERWETTYVDGDGEVWIRDYPHGELQGGGSPRLRRVGLPGTPADPEGSGAGGQQSDPGVPRQGTKCVLYRDLQECWCVYREEGSLFLGASVGTIVTQLGILRLNSEEAGWVEAGDMVLIRRLAHEFIRRPESFGSRFLGRF